MNATQDQAQAVVDWLIAKYGDPIFTARPAIYPGAHEGLRDEALVVSWEEGPDDWTTDESLTFAIPGVFVEPINHFAVGVYRA